MKRWAILAVLALSGCVGNSIDSQSARLEKFVGLGKVGTSADYYLVKAGMTGPERVALIYAMANDFEFCSEIATFYMEKYPASSYHCELANGP